jgi:hypothetical protein
MDERVWGCIKLHNESLHKFAYDDHIMEDDRDEHVEHTEWIRNKYKIIIRNFKRDLPWNWYLTFQRKHSHVRWDLYMCNQLYIRNHALVLFMAHRTCLHHLDLKEYKYRNSGICSWT